MFLKINANMKIGCHCHAESILSEGIENSVIYPSSLPLYSKYNNFSSVCISWYCI
jgi:hypothetical protein